MEMNSIIYNIIYNNYKGMYVLVYYLTKWATTKTQILSLPADSISKSSHAAAINYSELYIWDIRIHISSWWKMKKVLVIYFIKSIIILSNLNTVNLVPILNKAFLFWIKFFYFEQSLSVSKGKCPLISNQVILFQIKSFYFEPSLSLSNHFPPISNQVFLSRTKSFYFRTKSFYFRTKSFFFEPSHSISNQVFLFRTKSLGFWAISPYFE